ncbi:MAG: DUF885 family protein [Bryobacterales bacterium]|nr:DUF885 family protein [Bryobacterales bacterium]
MRPLFCVLCWAAVAAAQSPATSEPREWIEQYTADRGSLGRFYSIENSPNREERLHQLNRDWLSRLESAGFEKLSDPGKIDYLLFANHLQRQISLLGLRARQRRESAPLLPFATTVINLEESRKRMEPLDARKAAAALSQMPKLTEELHRSLKPGAARQSIAFRAAAQVDELKKALKSWYDFYAGYDPVATWWIAEPYKAAAKALDEYARFLREKILGLKPDDKETIIGDPIGRDALQDELAAEMIPYTPEELLAIAAREYAWCEREIRKASSELGFGDDWRKALEHVKNLYVDPGKQPELIRTLALEAIDYVEKNNLVTVPPLAKETWRMEMMSPERQLINPFFLGGEVIQVSYPAETMTQEQKLMSMRGNNPHFSRATVQHELIPGHHLQGFMTSRYRPYRREFTTPFWTEGWALYWEFLLWDRGFAKSAEDRIGMLFWRMHRCVRITFSLSFHLGKMTPRECIDLLVTQVGHERANAEAEVRRSFGGAYSPLYQAAYMLGGLQFYALHKDLVDSGKMTDRAFHDAILREGRIPVAMVRAILTNQQLTRGFRPSWRF